MRDPFFCWLEIPRLCAVSFGDCVSLPLALYRIRCAINRAKCGSDIHDWVFSGGVECE